LELLNAQAPHTKSKESRMSLYLVVSRRSEKTKSMQPITIFSVMTDECTDCSHQSQLSTCARYIY